MMAHIDSMGLVMLAGYLILGIVGYGFLSFRRQNRYNQAVHSKEEGKLAQTTELASPTGTWLDVVLI